MVENRGEVDLIGAVISTTLVAILALLGIYLFSELNQTVTIIGSLRGTGKELLIDAADALVLAVGGTSIGVTALLLLRAKAG